MSKTEKTLTFRRYFVRYDNTIQAYAEKPENPPRQSCWMNGMMNFFPNRSLSKEDPWWELLEIAGPVEITIRQLKAKP